MNVIEQISHRRSNWFICSVDCNNVLEHIFIICGLDLLEKDDVLSMCFWFSSYFILEMIREYLRCFKLPFSNDYHVIHSFFCSICECFLYLNKEKNVGIGKVKHSWHIRIYMFMYELSVIILSYVNHRINQEIVISNSQSDEFFYTF